MRQRVFTRALAVSAVMALGATGMTAAAHAAAPVAVKAAATAAKPFDFNGDGYPDVALGSPYGKVGSVSGAGFVTIVYGSKSGPNTGKKQIFSQATSGVPGTPESGDHFGYSLTSFDYDRDGHADLLIGAPDEDTGDGANAGSETILWGTSSGLTGASSDAITEPSTPGANHRFGYSLTSADFNADGYTDWVDSSPGDGYFWIYSSKPSTAAARTGRTFRPVGLGRPVRGTTKTTGAMAAVSKLDALVPATGDVNGDHVTDLVMGWRNSAADAKTQYGFDVWTDLFGAGAISEQLVKVDGLAVGDFNGDGYADVAAGESGDIARARSHVTVFSGDAGITLSDSYMINQETSGVPGATTSADRFGASLSAGDVDHDGKADLAVGVPGRTVSGQAGAGEAILLYGSASGLTGSRAQAVSQSTSGVSGAAEKGDAFGSMVSLLDVTNDGHADLIAGAPKENGGDGAISLLKGGTAGVTGTGSVSFGAGTLGVTGKSAQIGGIIGQKN